MVNVQLPFRGLTMLAHIAFAKCTRIFIVQRHVYNVVSRVWHLYTNKHSTRLLLRV